MTALDEDMSEEYPSVNNPFCVWLKNTQHTYVRES